MKKWESPDQGEDEAKKGKKAKNKMWSDVMKGSKHTTVYQKSIVFGQKKQEYY